MIEMRLAVPQSASPGALSFADKKVGAEEPGNNGLSPNYNGSCRSVSCAINRGPHNTATHPKSTRIDDECCEMPPSLALKMLPVVDLAPWCTLGHHGS
jgi:hypothetical protein